MRKHEIEALAIGTRGDKVTVLVKIDGMYREIELDADDPALEEKLRRLNAVEKWRRHLEMRKKREEIDKLLRDIKVRACRSRSGEQQK